MKKRLFLLPMMAGLALTGCSFTIFGTTITLFEDPLPENFKKEIDGYKMATSVKDGGKYILGVYRIREDKMNFASGEYHSDKNGQYSFYLGTTTKVAQAAEVEVKMTKDGKFTMKMIAPNKVWDGKYIGVYSATSSYENNVMSICRLDSPTSTSFTVVNKKSTSTVSDAKIGAEFTFFTTYEDAPAYAPACIYKHEGQDEEAIPKFIGTGHNTTEGEEDFTSMDCKSYQVALDLDSYDLMHLYEKA